ncbi:hypothetical protein CWATWH0402_2982 [Crocosphaera watsonii WH 0402]|uniref:Uncharacterized protein n=1 Tax=Crocosphaera watsonii WH 0402 TaxID=1284629 RepID=T2JYI1_CROWT|nr:hypothetical protein CWATWH0402_2982 [Crocosphaera watsonii WH 0402]
MGSVFFLVELKKAISSDVMVKRSPNRTENTILQILGVNAS